MYRKDLFKEWFGLHFTKCGWYLDYLEDYTPSSEVFLHESFELGFTGKALETSLCQGPKRLRDSIKKKGKEKSMALEIVVGIERPKIIFKRP